MKKIKGDFLIKFYLLFLTYVRPSLIKRRFGKKNRYFIIDMSF